MSAGKNYINYINYISNSTSVFEAAKIRSPRARADRAPKSVTQLAIQTRGTPGGARGTAGSRSHPEPAPEIALSHCRLCRLPPQLYFIRAEPTQDVIKIRVCKHLYKTKYKICRYLQSGNLHRFRWFRVYYLQIIQQRKWTLWINAHLLTIWKNNKDLQLYFSLLFCLSTLLNSSISFNLLPATFQLLKRLLMRACSCAMPNVLWIWKVLKTSKNMPFLPLPSKEKIKAAHNRTPYLISGAFHVPQEYLHPTESCKNPSAKAERTWDMVDWTKACTVHRGPQLSSVPSSVKVSFHPFRNTQSTLPICPWRKDGLWVQHCCD